MLNRPIRRAAAAAVATAALAASTSSAAILLSESFDYAPGALAGNNGGTGFSSAWSTEVGSAVTGGSSSVVAGSIAFSDYATSGNKLVMDMGTVSGFTSITSSRESAAAASTGDLFTSFLYQAGSFSSNSSRTAELRFEDPSIKFGSAAKGSGTATAEVRYDGVDGDVAGRERFGNLQNGSAFLIITKYSNLGVDGASARLWALNATGYDAISDGGITEAELDTAAFAISVDSQSATTSNVLTSGDLFRIGLYSSQTPFSASFDEFRAGTSLADVTAVPEPASAVAVVGLAGLLLGRRRASA